MEETEDAIDFKLEVSGMEKQDLDLQATSDSKVVDVIDQLAIGE